MAERTSTSVITSHEGDVHFEDGKKVKDIKVKTQDKEVSRSEVRSRFGGVDVLAVITGALAALGTAVFLSVAFTSFGRINYTTRDIDGQTLALAGLLGGLAALIIALFVGGWVSGRIARYDGGRNGLLTGVAFIALTATIAGLTTAAATDIVQQITLPDFFNADSLTSSAILGTVLALLVVLLMSYLGGKVGSHWHQKVDAVLLGARSGGVLRRTRSNDVKVVEAHEAVSSREKESLR